MRLKQHYAQAHDCELEATGTTNRATLISHIYTLLTALSLSSASASCVVRGSRDSLRGAAVFPAGAHAKTGTKPRFFFCHPPSEGESFSKSTAENSSWRLNGKQRAKRVREDTEQGFVEHRVCADSPLMSVCASPMCYFLLALESVFQKSWNVSSL